jgi:hypothetical protein
LGSILNKACLATALSFSNNKIQNNMENNSTVSIISVSDTKKMLQDAISNVHNNFLPEVKALATDLAAHNLPDKDAASIEPTIETIRATYSKTLNENSIHLSSYIRSQLGNLDIFSLKQKAKDIQLRANACSRQIDVLKTSREKYVGKSTWQEFQKMKNMLLICTILESLGYTGSFLVLHDPLLLAVLWGSILGILQTFGIEQLTLWLRDGSGAQFSKLTKRLIWGAVAAVATGLGYLRYLTMRSHGDTGFAMSPLAPVIFIMISYFLISVLAVYVWHNWPTKEEIENMKKAIEIEAEIAQRGQELEGYQNQLVEFTNQANTYAQVHSLLMHLEKDLHHKVNNDFKYAVGLFKNTNRIARTDNVSPECFAEPVADLAIPNYDQWSENQTNQKQINDVV